MCAERVVMGGFGSLLRQWLEDPVRQMVQSDDGALLVVSLADAEVINLALSGRIRSMEGA